MVGAANMKFYSVPILTWCRILYSESRDILWEMTTLRCWIGETLMSANTEKCVQLFLNNLQ